MIKSKEFSFCNCGIQSGEGIVYASNLDTKAVVVDDRHVFWNGKTMALSVLVSNIKRNTRIFRARKILCIEESY